MTSTSRPAQPAEYPTRVEAPVRGEDGPRVARPPVRLLCSRAVSTHTMLDFPSLSLLIAGADLSRRDRRARPGVFLRIDSPRALPHQPEDPSERPALFCFPPGDSWR